MEAAEIQVMNLDHLGLVAGIIDEIGLVEQIDLLLGQDSREKVSAGLVVKAMILNGLGFVSAPLYLFSRFFEGKATEHLIGAGVKPEHLNDDRLGRVLDGLFLAGLSSCFVSIAMKALAKFGVSIETAHLDSTSFHLHGEYETANDEVVVTQKTEDGTRVEIEVAPKAIHLTYGYSRDHRSDLKQFVMNLICGGEGGIPLFLEMADGNQDDKTKFAHLFEEFQKQWTFEGVHIADSALYTADNLKRMEPLKWVTRVPLTLAQAKQVLVELSEDELVESCLKGYSIAERTSNYGGVEQRWLIVKSLARQQSDQKQLQKKILKSQQQSLKQLQKLSAQEFSCEPDARMAAMQFSSQLKYHTLEAVEIIEQHHYSQPGRPGKQTRPTHKTYHIQATLVVNETVLEQQRQQAGRFILATNVLDKKQLNNDAVLSEYKEQQSTERGFSFLKDPLFFADSVFLKDPGRIAAVGMVMGLCLLVYNLGQTALRQALVQADDSLPNQLKKPTQRPTLRWIFQCFQAVHLLVIDGVKQIANLTNERLEILRFFSQTCRDYYLLC